MFVWSRYLITADRDMSSTGSTWILSVSELFPLTGAEEEIQPSKQSPISLFLLAPSGVREVDPVTDSRHYGGHGIIRKTGQQVTDIWQT